MAAALAPRGPDDHSLVEGDYYAVGFRRLAIVATEFGRQPVSDPTRDVTLAFNGEIYNYGALAEDLLRSRGVPVRSEAEALLALYLSHGVEFTLSIDGDYAIVVCDGRTRECHLFRDPFGVKPLYYAPIAGGRAWAAASEVQAFFRHPDFSTAWDEIALWERRVLGFAAFDRTSFEAIRQVPPGARVTLSVAAPPRVVDAPKDPAARATSLSQSIESRTTARPSCEKPSPAASRTANTFRWPSPSPAGSIPRSSPACREDILLDASSP